MLPDAGLSRGGAGLARALCAAARRPLDPVARGARPQPPAYNTSDRRPPKTSTTKTTSTAEESRTVDGGRTPKIGTCAVRGEVRSLTASDQS
jgi:hypothetical protein